LEFNDVKHLDDLPIGEQEMHGRKGPLKHNRRATKKILYEMRWLMKYIEAKLEERNLLQTKDNDILSVDRMFAAVSDIFPPEPRNQQTIWNTVCQRLMRRERIEKKVLRQSATANV
jgi:hypothetical protein